MKNKTLYSKIVSLKKKFFKKQIIPSSTAEKIDSFFNNLHNSIYQTKDNFRDNFIKIKDISRDKIIRSRDLTRDLIIQKKDLTRDLLIQKKDIVIDKISEKQNTNRETLGDFFQKNESLVKTKNIFTLFFEIIKIIFITLYYAKWNVSEKTDQEAVKNIKKIIVNSENVKKRVNKYYTRDSEIIYPPTNTERIFFKEIGDFWLSVNRLTPEKRTEMQLEAFRKMPEKKLIIVGGFDGKNSYIESIFNDKPENVTFIKNLNENELIELYSKCIGFITTAKDEDFGMTAVEAMASGKPVIAPNEGGYKETIINNETGILIDDINADKIVGAVKKIESDLSINKNFYEDNCQNRSKLFSESNFINKLENFLNKSIYFDKNKQLIFIVGVPRSGTTWLWGLLTSHPEVEAITKKDFDPNSNHIESNMLFDKNFKEICDVLNTKKAKFIVEKTPDHLMEIERIKNDFPTAKIIHIVRNPFSVYSSYKNSDWDKKDIAVEEWLKIYFDRIRMFLKHHNYKNIYNVRYEDLNKNPEKTLKKMFAFLNLNSKNIKEIIESNKMISKSSGKHGIRKAENNSWISELSKKEKDFIYYYTKNIKPIQKFISVPFFEKIKLIKNSLLFKDDFINKKLIFIVGVPRSGTTWLWNLISEVPNVHTLTANDFRIFKKNNFHIKEESNALFDHKINKIKKVISKIRKNIVVEKTPLNVTKIKEIKQNFPNSKIIHVIRNPEAVYASYKLTYNENWAYKNINVEDWVVLYKNIFKEFKDYIESENIQVTSYEKLLNNTKDELKKVYSFADLPEKYIDSAILNSRFEKAFPLIYRTKGINTLTNDISDYEKAYISENLKEEIEILKKYYE